MIKDNKNKIIKMKPKILLYLLSFYKIYEKKGKRKKKIKAIE
jgi:hypothetical protein